MKDYMSILIKRWLKASHHSFDGFKVLLQERAFREELFFTVIGLLLVYAMPISSMMKLILILLSLFLLIVEAINSAIESTIDRISTDIHPLSKIVKDIGSASVTLAILMNFIAWLFAFWLCF